VSQALGGRGPIDATPTDLGTATDAPVLRELEPAA
jgi:hypothetical protein